MVRKKLREFLMMAAATALPLHAAAQDGLAAAFKHLADDTWITRSITFADLGVAQPAVLDLKTDKRDFYLPVPANVELKDAAIRLDVGYLLAAQGRNSFVLSLDDTPVAARAFGKTQGDSTIDVAVDATPRPSGFVRLGAKWSAAVAAAPRCTDAGTAGNLVKVAPQSSFTYRFNSAAIRDLATAWSALPPSPAVLVAGRGIAAPSYDAAWRIGATLAHAGKRPAFRALPRPGDEIDLQHPVVAPALTAIPAFAALSRGGVVRLQNSAQVGALLALGKQGPLRVDVVVADDELQRAVAQALAALESEVRSVSADAAAEFRAWQTAANGIASGPQQSRDVRLATIAGQPAIAVGVEAGAQAAMMFTNFARGLAGTSALKFNATQPAPDTQEHQVLLSQLGGPAASMDLLSRAEWQAAFGLGDAGGNGVPVKLVMDVSAAPSSQAAVTVMSVFYNGVLLGTRHLTANSERERLALRIPSYALGASNLINVVFQRQALSGDCDVRLVAAPVSVLPTSHLVFASAELHDDFTGMVARFGSGAQLIVPPAYLDDAPRSLERVVRVSDAAGVLPFKAAFSVAPEKDLVKPGAAFIAFDLPLKREREKVGVTGSRLVLPAQARRVGMDVDGLSRIGVVEVNRVGGQPGILYRAVGAEPAQLDKPFRLSRGDVAIVGSDGLLTEIDSDGSYDGRLIASSEEAWLQRMLWWVLPTVAITLFVLLLVAASFARRRAAAKASREHAP